MLNRLLQMRRQFADELGIIVPPIHIRDNLTLESGTYRLLLKGTPVGDGSLMPGRLLAIDPGGVETPVPGVATKDPTFGLDALWISAGDRYRAEAAGYTVVDLEGVITTHVSELVRQNAHELFGWTQLQERLDHLKAAVPKLVEEIIPNVVSVATALRVLRGLLAERVSIRDLRTIFEALAIHGGGNASVSTLVDHVRARLAPQITADLQDTTGAVHAALLDRRLEERLRQCLVTQDGEPVMACDLATAQGMFSEIERLMPHFAAQDVDVTVLSPPDLRGPLQRFLCQFFPTARVVSHREIASRARVVSVGQLELRDGAALGQSA